MSSSVPPGVAAPELRAYLELTELYDQRGEANMRDRFLILAADAAGAAGLNPLADQLLHRLVQFSPHHMFRAYRSFAEALKAEPVRTYLADLKQNYPPEMVRNLLESLRGRSTPPAPEPLPQTLPAASIPVAHNIASDETAVLPPPPAPARRPASAREGAAPAEPSVPGAAGAAPSRPPQARQEPRPPVRGSAASPPPAAVPARPAPAQPGARPPVARAVPAASPAAPAPAVPARPRPLRAPAAQAGPRAAWPAPDSGELEPPGGGWLATLLFLVVLLAGLALVGYTLARPFLTGG